MIPLHTAWNIGHDSFAELVRHGLERRGRADHMVDESGLPLLGDDLIPEPSAVRTLAVTVAAPLREIEPWLVQMLRGGGVYGWSELESPEVGSAQVLLGDVPSPHVGDHFGDLLEIARVDDSREIVWRSLEPLEVMGNVVDALTVDYLLHPVAEGRTRLLARVRLDARHLTRQVLLFILDTIELALVGAQLDNLRQLAEARLRGEHPREAGVARVGRHQHPAFRPAPVAAGR